MEHDHSLPDSHNEIISIYDQYNDQKRELRNRIIQFEAFGSIIKAFLGQDVTLWEHADLFEYIGNFFKDTVKYLRYPIDSEANAMRETDAFVEALMADKNPEVGVQITTPINGAELFEYKKAFLECHKDDTPTLIQAIDANLLSKKFELVKSTVGKACKVTEADGITQFIEVYKQTLDSLLDSLPKACKEIQKLDIDKQLDEQENFLNNSRTITFILIEFRKVINGQLKKERENQNKLEYESRQFYEENKLILKAVK